MPEYRAVCGADEIPPGGARLVRLDGREIALFHTDEGLFAMEDTCLHAGGPLHEGSLEGRTVVCPWHQWKFDVATGRCELNPKVSLDCFPVRVVDGVIEVAV